METKTIKLTKSGLENFKKEYNELVNELIVKNNIDIATAKEYGDLSENSDYKFAKEKQAKFDQRKYELEAILNNYELIEEDIDTSKVGLGTTVIIIDKRTNKKETYKIVDTVEIDVFNNKISLESPLGFALKGKTVNDVCQVKVAKPYIVKIVSITK